MSSRNFPFTDGSYAADFIVSMSKPGMQGAQEGRVAWCHLVADEARWYGVTCQSAVDNGINMESLVSPQWTMV